jgi:hypothetical protein
MPIDLFASFPKELMNMIGEECLSAAIDLMTEKYNAGYPGPGAEYDGYWAAIEDLTAMRDTLKSGDKSGQ